MSARVRYTALYPLLFAATRVLYVAAQNPGQFAVGDLMIVLATTLMLVIAVYGMATLLFRGRGEGMLPALITFIVLAWVFGASPIEEWLTREEIRFSPFILAAVGAIASAFLMFQLVRRPHVLRVGATFLTLTYSLLVLYLSASIGIDWWRARKYVAASRLVDELARPWPPTHGTKGPSRDIYVLVLDEYANAAVLKEVLGFDNREFEDSLRALGFYVPRSVNSNYAHTYLSLPSLLNAAQVTAVETDLPRGSNDPTLLNHLVGTSRVARFLQERGYRFVFFPSAWWNSTRTSPIADSVVDVMPGFSIGRELSRTEFRRVFRRNTISWHFYHEAAGDDAIVRSTLEGVSRLPAVPGPVFAFAHLMIPHPPNVFDRSCGTRRTEWGRDRAGYLANLECLNHMLLATVSTLIRDSDVPPVIVLQGDHGTMFRLFGDAPSLAQVPMAAARERFGAFGAYYFPPDGAERVIGDSVTVVNVLRHVLRHYFGADIALESDELFLSMGSTPFEFRRMSRKQLAEGLDSIRPGGRATQPKTAGVAGALGSERTGPPAIH